jgi:hypothetical protein
MTAPTSTANSGPSWKRIGILVLAVLAVTNAPGPTGEFTARFVHGLGDIGCRVSHTTCFEDTTAELNPLHQVSTRVETQP